MYFSFNAVSACRGAFDRNTNEQSLIDWLENVRPTHADVQRNKKALPAIMPHGLFMSRKKDSLARHSGLVQVDIDGKHQAEPKSWESLVRSLDAFPHVVAGGISCGGNGVYILIAVEDINAENHATMAHDVCDWVEANLDVVTDRPVSVNLASIRFASPWVPYINLDVTPLDLKA